jgi:hypothetical protein
MRRTCALALFLLIAAGVFAQSRLNIDKLDRKSLSESKKEVASAALLEGTVSDSKLSVFVMVYEPDTKAPRFYETTVDETRTDPAGGYRWRAICNFGKIGGP